MLNLVQLSGEIAGVMVVDHRQRSYNLRRWCPQLVFDKRGAHEVADCLGAVGSGAAARSLRVKSGEQVFWHGDREPDEIGRAGVHGCSRLI